MVKSFLLIVFLGFAFNSYSQDIIIRTNGSEINCKITKVDSVNVIFNMLRQGTEISTSIERKQVKEIKYGTSSEQSSATTISMKKVFGGYQFYQGDKILTMSQLVETMQLNVKAYKEVKEAQSTNTIASIFSGAGGFMVGWPIGTAIGGGKPNWTMAGVGAVLVVISIPISLKFNEQVKTAVDTFNGKTTSSIWDKTELRFAFIGNGIGLSLRF